MDKHVIIIGSGLGGLTCGYILAKNGYRVSILEKNAQLGGCLQVFTRKGATFETGMHYIGSMEPGQNLYHFFKYLSLLPDVKLYPLDRVAYDVISVAGERFSFANGQENFIETLAQRFPGERSNLQNYYRTIEDVADNSPLYRLRPNNSLNLLNPDYIKKSASELIASTINHPLLQQVVAGNVPLYAGIEGKTSFYIHAFINHFYNRSAYRIVGGSGVIAHSLVRSIHSMGGSVYASSPVTAIHCNSTQAVSVTLKNGEEIQGDYFISDIHPLRTMELLKTPLIRKSYHSRILNLKNTASNFTVYVQFKKDKVPYLNSNFYHYNGNSVYGCENYTQQDWPKGFLYMHHCPSIAPQYAETAVILSYMNFEEVSRWKGTPVGRRGEDYENFKRQKAERLLDELEKQMPGTRSNIECYYTSTPLTYLDYTGTEAGSMYGRLRDCSEPVQNVVSQRTRIPNLFLVGQNTNSHGALGVTVGAIITSSELLDINTIVKQIRDTA
ncbi:MAG: NAD(P)/FAD-dependent oxidoreductase [Dysgonamonadaceae bacterium]|jgi:all-trans-retinol 13,14-reductase|nr:NAD(P)/FAD-dependent oxidoreductase [Dysgonamonadaceae bacterium]